MDEERPDLGSPLLAAHQLTNPLVRWQEILVSRFFGLWVGALIVLIANSQLRNEMHANARVWLESMTPGKTVLGERPELLSYIVN